jgi:hypothetical protein
MAANRRCLATAVAIVRERLERHAAWAPYLASTSGPVRNRWLCVLDAADDGSAVLLLR